MFLNAPYDKSHHPTLGGLPKDVSTRPDETMPWRCITNTPTQYLYAIDDEPGRLYKMTLDGKILGMLGISGRQKRHVQLGPRHRLSVGEHRLHRGHEQLAAAETDPAPRTRALRGARC